MEYWPILYSSRYIKAMMKIIFSAKFYQIATHVVGN